MAMLKGDMKTEGGSFMCIICKSRKPNDVHLLDGKKCTEKHFVDKLIKLVTKQFYLTLCESFKSHNNKNYVCRSCFMMIINTHDNIVRLQTGVAQSIKKRLRSLQPQNMQKDLDDNVDFKPLEIRKKKKSSAQDMKKERLGKHGVSSLTLVRVNNIFPKIILKKIFSENDSHMVATSSGEFENGDQAHLELIDFAHLSAVASKTGDSSSSLSTTFFNSGVDELKNSDENLFSSGKKKLSLESLLDAAKAVEASHNFTLLNSMEGNKVVNDMRERSKTTSYLNKPGPMSWKMRTKRMVLPSVIDKPDPLQVKNLFVKNRTPIHLARLRNNNIHMCTEPNCDWVFMSIFSLNNHVKHFHFNGKPHKCPIEGCLKAYPQKSKLQEHIKSHIGDKPFVCNTCGKGFCQSVSLKHHMVTHTDKANEKNYKCPRPGCKQAYKYPHTLKRHLEFHDGGVLPFSCPYPDCNKAYKSNYELKCHYRHHTGEKPYKCDEPGCGKSFRLPGQYTIHRRNHRGERPFKCLWEGCDAAYSSRGQLENHALCHKGKTFICDTCGKTFTYKVAMIIHRKKMHTDERDFVCQVEGCDRAFHFRFALNAHVTKIHNAKHIDKKRRVARGSKKVFLLYPCPVQGCNKEYVAKTNIEKHLQQQHGLVDVKIEPKIRSDFLTCPIEGCESQFLTERNLRYHKMSAHNPLSVHFKKVGGKRFSCSFEGCNRVYETMNAMREHVNRVHTSVPREKMCFQCGAAFKHIQQLEVHRQVMHGEESVLNEQKRGIYICKSEGCEVQFSNAEDLTQHVHVHIENPPYRCDFTGCKRAFLLLKNYSNHVLIHNNEKPFSCSYQGCEVKCGTQFEVLKHSINHYGNYRCPVESCGRMLMSLNSGRVHMFRHTGEKPYVCGICGMAFAVSSNLLRHRRTHTGEKPFECKICLKRFADKAVLTTHIRRHTGEKPYVCNICGQSFSSLSGVKIHMRLHTGESPYVCSEEGCDKRFRDISGLKSHKNVHTKASHLCSQCGKVYKWGIKKHKCKIVPESVATPGSSKKYQQVQEQIQQSQQQKQLQQQQPQQLKQQEILQQRQQLQPLSVLLQQQQQEIQHQQHQQPLQLSQQTHIQLQQTQTLSQVTSELPEQPQQAQLHLTSIIQEQHQHTLQQQQQQQQQQQSVTILQALQQPSLQIHQPHQLQHQVQIPLHHPHQQQTIPQTPYVMGNMVMMQEQLHPGLSYVRENVESGRTGKPENVAADPFIMHDLDNNYMILYDRSGQQQ